MPCNSDYLKSTNWEVSLSQVCCLLDEIETGAPINKDHWRGYHPKVYNRHISKDIADVWVGRLCDQLKNKDVTKYSLEMQIWWRDHQEADANRN